MALNVTVDHNVCVGTRMCVHFAGSVFAINDEGQSEVTDPAGADRDTIVDAASQCPVEAITVIDTETNKTLFP